jgi:hypothetical protein
MSGRRQLPDRVEFDPEPPTHGPLWWGMVVLIALALLLVSLKLAGVSVFGD